MMGSFRGFWEDHCTSYLQRIASTLARLDTPCFQCVAFAFLCFSGLVSIWKDIIDGANFREISIH